MKKNPEIFSIANYQVELERALSSGDFVKALSPALNGYALATSKGDKLNEKVFLSYLKIATDELHGKLIPQNSSNDDFKTVCSFCYKVIGDSLCVLGAKVSICSECIRLAAKAIEEKTQGQV